jgi:hypothetical protein
MRNDEREFMYAEYGQNLRFLRVLFIVPPRIDDDRRVRRSRRLPLCAECLFCALSQAGVA